MKTLLLARKVLRPDTFRPLNAISPKAICNPWRNFTACSLRYREVSTPTDSSIPKTNLPLAGLRVVDLTRVLAGPWCTQLLADNGANVIKIEHPSGGDETRQWRIAGEGAFWHPDKGKLMSLYFAAVNRNKRSVTLDLKSPKGREIVMSLVQDADVVINNFLPGTMERLGLGWEEVRAANPRIVYASVSGYGSSGPNMKRAGYDAIALAEAGLLHITGEADGPPTKPGVAIADLCTGLYMYGALLAALRGRDANGGMGCRVDGSLFESSLSLLINVGMAAINMAGKTGQRFGLGHSSLVPYGGFETGTTGRYLYIAANNDRQWKLFCTRMGIDGMGDDERFATNDGRIEHRDEIDGMIQRRFKEKGLREWMEVFEGSGLPYGAINDVKEALEHEQATARGMVQELQFEAAQEGILKMIGPAMKIEGVEFQVRRKPPTLGQHTAEVLEELGFSDKDIESFRIERII